MAYPLIFIGATNKPNDLDPAIRRPGRFDREIIIEPPTKEERIKLIRKILINHKIEDIFDVILIMSFELID